MVNCKELGIPDHLHKNERIAENHNFTSDEKMFRRVIPKESLSELLKYNFDFKLAFVEMSVQ